MNWYIAKIIFGICVNEAKHTTQFDEQLRFISAQNENEAFIKARLIGVREEDSFLNEAQHSVKWEFIDVAELNLVPKLKDEIELYSCIHEREEAEHYVRYVQQKAAMIASRIQQPSTLTFQKFA